MLCGIFQIIMTFWHNFLLAFILPKEGIVAFATFITVTKQYLIRIKL